MRIYKVHFLSKLKDKSDLPSRVLPPSEGDQICWMGLESSEVKVSAPGVHRRGRNVQLGVQDGREYRKAVVYRWIFIGGLEFDSGRKGRDSGGGWHLAKMKS